MVALGLIGEPCVGKTSVMRELLLHQKGISRIQFGSAKAIEVKGRRLFVLGVYDGGVCDGTDRLSMNCYKDSLSLASWMIADKKDHGLLWEGDRMNNAKWIDALKALGVSVELWHLEASEEVMAERRRLRNSTQSSRWAMGIKTKVDNMSKMYQARRIEMSGPDSAKVAADEIIKHFAVKGLQ